MTQRDCGLGLLMGVLEIDFNDFDSLFWAGFVPPHSYRIQGSIDQHRAAPDWARTFDTAVRRNNHFHFHFSTQFHLSRQGGVLRLDPRRDLPLNFSLIGFLRERGRL
jgi:hypothetical protein